MCKHHSGNWQSGQNILKTDTLQWGQTTRWSKAGRSNHTQTSKKKHATPTEATIPCPNCHRLFRARIVLTSHLRTYRPTPQRRQPRYSSTRRTIKKERNRQVQNAAHAILSPTHAAAPHEQRRSQHAKSRLALHLSGSGEFHLYSAFSPCVTCWTAPWWHVAFSQLTTTLCDLFCRRR